MTSSPLIRALWLSAGGAALVAGIIGIFLPVWPTVPFLLLAAFCFQRGSDRLHNWLINHPRFGPPIESWRNHGAISKRAKLLSVATMLAVITISFVMAVPTYVLIIQLLVLSGAATFILTRPLPPNDQV